MKDINWFKESQGIILGALCMSVLMFACDATPFIINHKWRRDAINRGFARWEVDSEGEATFKWNEPPVAVPEVSEVHVPPASNEDTAALLLFPEPILPK